MPAAALQIPDTACRAFVGLYELAGDDGIVPGVEVIAAALGLSPLTAARTLVALADAGLIGEDGQGRIQLGKRTTLSTSSNEGGKITKPHAGNVTTLSVRGGTGPAKSPAERSRAYRARRRQAARQLNLPLFGVVAGGVPRPARVTKPAVTDVTEPVTDVTIGRDAPVAGSEKHEEIQWEPSRGAATVAKNVTAIRKNRSCIYFSSNNDLLEDTHTTGYCEQRDAVSQLDRRHSRFPAAVTTVFAHCFGRWPPRKPDNPRKKALAALAAVWEPDDDPQTVIAAFERWRRSDYVLEHEDTKYIPQAATWFGDRRWESWLETAAPDRRDAARVVFAPPPINPAATGDPRWRTLAARLSAELGADVWSSWFGRLVPVGLDGNRLRIAAPTRFAAAWVGQHYGDRLHDAVRAAYGADRVVLEAQPEASRASSMACGVTETLSEKARGPP